MGLDPWPGLCQRSVLFATVGDGLWPCYSLARLAWPGFQKAFEIYPSSPCLSFLSSPGGGGVGNLALSLAGSSCHCLGLRGCK